MKSKNILLCGAFSLMIFFVFRSWFVNTEILGGDWPYFSQEAINNFPSLPPSWSGTHGNGFGGTIITYGLDTYLYSTGWFFSQILHIPWVIVYKFFWFGMFLFLSIFSSIFLIRTALSKTVLWQKLLGAFLYTANTYILLVTSGGQMGVALAYGIAPLVLAIFMKSMDSFTGTKEEWQSRIKLSLLSGLILSLQILFDFRFAYMTMFAVVLYYLFTMSRQRVAKLFFSLVIPVGISVLLHLFWILPLLVFRQNPTASLDSVYTSVASLQFFSFATFENSLGLLHPNWPENIFGKVAFMKPEFLLLPLLAFSSLLFLTKDVKKNILFFALLSLFGAFLAKGAQAPFGQLYIWAFEHIPGFVMFRDPTKWYLLIALSYSVLIPFALKRIFSIISNTAKFSIKPKIFNLQNIFVVLLISYFFYLIHPAFFGQLGRTFQSHTVPQEYVQLRDKLGTEKSFYRTLWVPRQSRFTYNSYTHPSVEADPLFHATNAAEFSQRLHDPKTQSLLSNRSIKYVIVPYDSLGEIFVKDRKYDPAQPKAYTDELQKITWLSPVDEFHDLAVFQIKQYKDHLFLEKGEFLYRQKNSDLYHVAVVSLRRNNLFFSENYHPSWELHVGDKKIFPQKTPDGLMRFAIPAGEYQGELIFVQRDWYSIGFIISFSSFIILLGVYFMLQYKDFLIYLRNTF